MRYVEAPHPVPALGWPQPLVFLAGGIFGCPDWQAVVRQELCLAQVGPHALCGTLLNPRRANFSINDPDVSEAQIIWEHDALRKADIVAFWFCKETVQPIVLFELGAALERLGNIVSRVPRIIIGIEAGYPRTQDVEIQTRLVMGHDYVIHHSFDAYLSALRLNIFRRTNA